MSPGSVRARSAFALLWLLGGAGLACRSAAPLAGADARPVAGTIAGQVAGPGEAAPLRSYVVEATRLDDGALYTARTMSTGRFSLEVPPGRYRLRILLGDGEKLVEAHDEIAVESGGLVTDADFVVAAAGP